MFTYKQSTGSLSSSKSAKPLGTCYSGHGPGVNNPVLQNVAMIGPIPVGTYTIETPITHPTCGPEAMRLIANPGTNTFGRGGFLMHGDNSLLNHTASEGCIIAPRGIRDLVAAAVAAGDNQLTVIS
jgi:hypothetical protein